MIMGASAAGGGPEGVGLAVGLIPETEMSKYTSYLTKLGIFYSRVQPTFCFQKRLLYT